MSLRTPGPGYVPIIVEPGDGVQVNTNSWTYFAVSVKSSSGLAVSIKWCLAPGAEIYDGVSTKAGDMASFRILHPNPGTYCHEIQRIEGARVESLHLQVSAVSSQLKKSLTALTKRKRRKPQPKNATAKGKK